MKKWRIKHLAILAATIVTFSSNNIYATSGQPSGKRLIPYDGTLRDDGVEANGNFDFVFFLCNTADATVCTISNYDDLSNPTNLGEGIIWVESFTSENNNPVFVANGKFAVMLGEIKDLTDEVFATDELYLGIAVRPEGGAYVELTNRQRITPNAYVHARQGGVDNFIVPRGAVMFFNLTACPIGWSAMSNAEGRVVVGVGSSGTVAGVVGTALTNMSKRTISEVPEHKHTLNSTDRYDPYTLKTGEAGAHSHTYDSGSGGFGYGTSGHVANYIDIKSNTSYVGNHTHSIDLKQLNISYTGSKFVDVTMPYIQLLVCQKN